jgi:predicted ArsR family transcriptional regulator
LRNCPFHHLVEDHRELVCALNEELLSAMVHASGVALEARLDPRPGYCCVLLRRART